MNDNVVEWRMNIVRLIFPYIRKIETFSFLHSHIFIVSFPAGSISVGRKLRLYPNRFSIFHHMIRKPI